MGEMLFVGGPRHGETEKADILPAMASFLNEHGKRVVYFAFVWVDEDGDFPIERTVMLPFALVKSIAWCNLNELAKKGEKLKEGE